MRLPRAFFNRNTLQVARELLGCILVHALDDGTRLSGRIIETEAYLPGDMASHGYCGKTQRNMAMFMRAGVAYVYFIYGMHFCFNVVTEGEGVPAAVLLRAVQPVDGIEVMRRNRVVNHNLRFLQNLGVSGLCNGPGKLCQAFAIDRSANGIDLCARKPAIYRAQKPDRRSEANGPVRFGNCHPAHRYSRRRRNKGRTVAIRVAENRLTTRPVHD